ncbi:GEVED domain-containing protein [Flavobacterium sp. DGU11]|uniref:GEVED domain-containing protein n=1 Tax=Flavobacterium arundinis TaxID=3139143 RepID=A0ABU9HU59_9FLAO
MKTRLQLLFYALLICSTVIFSNDAVAQIAYNAAFNNGMSNWDSDEFYHTTDEPCMGNGALRVNLYDSTPSAELLSPSIGTSNGGVVTFNYRYKLLNYDNFPDDATQNAGNWGTLRVYYALSAAGPWNVLQTMDPANHVESLNCVTKTVTFVPPAGSNVYLRVLAEIGDMDNDFYVYFDQVQVTQATPTACAGTPAASQAVASATITCATQNVVLSLAPGYSNTGLNYQWQSSTNGTDYTNVPTGGTAATYTATQSASTWYRAQITCGAGGDTTTSAPVQVASTGGPCYCDIDFLEGIEPITRVSFAGINNVTSAEPDGTPALEDFTSLTPGVITQGQTYPITLQGNTVDEFLDGYQDYFKVHIDFNHNGTFEAAEGFELGYIEFSDGEDDVQLTGTIAIPADAVTGLARMRVVKQWYDDFGGTQYTDPCGSDNSGYGQAEDYLLNIQAASTETLDYVNLQWPATMTFAAGGSDTAYAQAWKGGLTEAPGAGAGIMAWIGISPAGSNTNPNTWTNWVPATFNVQAGNNDEYMAAIGAGLAPGTYYYASRFTLNGGPYTYGGFTPTGGGTWDGTTNVSGVLTVTCSTTAPVAAATQTFCSGATVANLQATGAVISWYNVATGGTALAPTTVLTGGATYYASITPAGGCESTTRTAVTVVITSTPAPDADATQTFCSGATVADLQATGSVILWYSAATGGTALASTTVLASGNYYASVTPAEGCESTARTMVEVTITTVQVPTVTVVQPACGDPTGTITVNSPVGAGFTYDANGTGFQASATFTNLVPGTYTITAKNASGCTASVPVIINGAPAIPDAPVVTIVQPTCSVATGSITITSPLGANLTYAIDGGTFQASPVFNDVMPGNHSISVKNAEGCIGLTSDIVVNAVPAAPDAPTGDATQEIAVDAAQDATIEDITVTADGTVKWYASQENAEAGENALEEGTVITNGTYYATQTVDDCQSAPFAVTVAITLGIGEFDAASFRYHPNPVKDILTLSYDKNISGIEVYNIVGQKVIVKLVNQNEARLDMSQLAAGTYLVKVVSDAASKTIKILKQ